ncbi:protein MULTIPOLAR SPINDLE 1 [Sesbania bispinosa]|nr:protein MULTIPOLAR SPINDLE 1 [Sesbania bispinosa]
MTYGLFVVVSFCKNGILLGTQHTGTNAQFCIQHLIRKLGSEHYIGQRALLSVCQRVLVLAERLLFSDPFDDAFTDMHECMFIMIQLIEFLVTDYLLGWSKAEDFDNTLLEDWVTSIIQARKALELLESRNGLYVLYMDRVTGELAKQASGVSCLQKLKPDIFNSLYR